MIYHAVKKVKVLEGIVRHFTEEMDEDDLIEIRMEKVCGSPTEYLCKKMRKRRR